MNFKIYAIALVSLLTGCDTGGRLQNTKELSNEIKSSEIKRVTNTQLVYTVDEWGKKIAVVVQKSLESELRKNPGQSAQLCKEPGKIPVVAALQKEYGVQIQLLGIADLKNKSLAPKEKEILDAYLYSAKLKKEASDNVQKLNDTLFVYNIPVPADHPVCKTCMGDQPVPFAVWRLLFDKKAIIRKLDAKKLKD